MIAIVVALAASVAAAVLILAREGQGGRGVRGSEDGPARRDAALPRVVDVGARLRFPRDAGSWGIDAGDLSGDGRPDLVVSYHNSVRAYRNAGGTGFEEVFRQDRGDPHDCLIGDVDLDGLGDIYCTRGARRGTGKKANSLWLQDPAGTFPEDVARDFGVADPFGRGRHATFIDIDGDPYPDLFVGNAFERADEKPTPNRTYLNEEGERFREVDLGATGQLGGHCAQAVDFDRDGWEDLLVCGERRLLLYRNVEAPDGGRTLREVWQRVGGGMPRVGSAWIEDFDGDGRPDIAMLEDRRLRVLLGHGRRFGRQAFDMELENGRWVAVGDVDGGRGPDLYVTQGCASRGGPNLDNLLLLNDGAGGFEAATTPQATSGCGDMAEAIDIDGDGRDEIVVLNGRPLGSTGPVQVLTRSPALAP